MRALTRVVAVSVFALVISAQSAHATVMAYVSNSGDNTISVIDTSTNTVTATIPVGSSPGALAVSPDGAQVYVANRGDGVSPGSLTVVSTASNSVIATVPVGINPAGVTALSDGSRVYVNNRGDNTVSVIDTASDTVTNALPVGMSPLGLAALPNGSRVYVGNLFSNTISVIDTNSDTVTVTIPFSSPTFIAIRPDGGRAFVGTPYAKVAVIDTASNTVTDAVNVPPAFPGGNDGLHFMQFPTSIVTSPNSQSLYVTAVELCLRGPPYCPFPGGQSAPQMFEYSATTYGLTWSAAAIDFDTVGAAHPSGRWLYASASNHVSVIDTATNATASTIVVGNAVADIAVGPCTADSDCNDSAIICTSGTCDRATGRCAFTPTDEGATCNSGQACAELGLDTCQAGVCTPGGDTDHDGYCNNADGSLTLMHVHIVRDAASAKDTGATIVRGTVRDAAAGVSMRTAVLSNTLTVQVRDSAAFNVTIPVTGCSPMGSSMNVRCRWTGGFALLLKRAAGGYTFVATHRGLNASVTGTTTPVGPASVVLRSSGIDQRDDISCRNMGSATLHCLEP
ncbi:MAG: YncE family protein [Deltaproteobacteria bacterium]|nr:YncE family protein [Deltaproteobacteria bacterium]MBI3387972.1 YncE family protein [Deltaproteobacteria bacterium]